MAKSNQVQTVETIRVFGIETPNKKLSRKELVDLVRENFENFSGQIGRMANYLVALKHLQITDESYPVLVAIAKKLMEINGLTTNTTEKCFASYMKNIKNGKTNYNEPFKSGRAKVDREQISKEIAELLK